MPWHTGFMPRRISTKRPLDENQAAFLMVERSTTEIMPPPASKPKKRRQTKADAEISRVMAAMGRKGGKIGGKKRLKSMTPEERSQVALKAAKARWDKAKAAAIEQPPVNGC